MNIPDLRDDRALPPLPFAALSVGHEFAAQQFAVTHELVRAYVTLTGDDNPLYLDDRVARAAGLPGAVMPPGLAGIWARRSYLARHRMLPGGVMAGQSLEFTASVVVGEALTLSATVAAHDPSDPKRRVLLDCRARRQNGVEAGRVQIDARWPDGDGS
jgi:acyl dehydratase